ncbi:MAG: hypothetical protein HQL64_03030 [Magnetococcales bacterium]|nr:hypothetical protein [Magnetococcales bacterium]
MKDIVLIDTSVLLNILDVPKRNQMRDEIDDELGNLTQEETELLLPMATIVETGNFIVKIEDGNSRRELGEAFIETIRESYEGNAPWSPIDFPDLKSVMPWLDEFPEYAMRGIGFADLSIIKDWERMCRLNPRSRVRIWSLDKHLSGYDSKPGALPHPGASL